MGHILIKQQTPMYAKVSSPYLLEAKVKKKQKKLGTKKFSKFRQPTKKISLQKHNLRYTSNLTATLFS